VQRGRDIPLVAAPVAFYLFLFLRGIVWKGEAVAVRIRMTLLGRKHRPFYRIVATDVRQPRDGRYLEELGTYDPMVKTTDERVRLRPDRIKYWLSVGARPSEKVAVFLRKYMKKFEEQQAAAAAAPAPPAAEEAPAPPETT
jgi:small subunit ribosomal protein S16